MAPFVRSVALLGLAASLIWTSASAAADAPPSPSPAPRIEASQVTGNVGAPVDIVGAGFPPNATFLIYVDIPASSAASSARTSQITSGSRTDAHGAFHVSITMPMEPGGQHQICADTGYPGSTEPAQVKACTAFLVEPLFMLSASGGKVGDKLTVSGTGFTPGTVAALYRDSLSRLLGTPGPTVDSNGSFTADVTIGGSSGAHGICVQVVQQGSGSFVGPPICVAMTVVPLQPAIVLSSDAGVPGSVVGVSGQGLAVDQPLYIALDGHFVSCAGYYTTDGGFFSAVVTVDRTFFDCRYGKTRTLSFGKHQICALAGGQPGPCATFLLESSEVEPRLAGATLPLIPLPLIAFAVVVILTATGIGVWVIVRRRRRA